MLQGHLNGLCTHRPLIRQLKSPSPEADLQVFESYQNKVLRDSTASRSGITSTAKYAPRSNTCCSSSGINFFQILHDQLVSVCKEKSLPQEMFRDLIRSSSKDVMRIDIIVTQTWHYGDIFRYNLHHLVDHHCVEFKDLLWGTR